MIEFTEEQIAQMTDWEKVLVINHLIYMVNHYEEANRTQLELIELLVTDPTWVGKRHKPFSTVNGGKG